MRLKSFFSILAGAALIFSACSPEEYEMGAKTYVSSREPLPCGSLQAVLLKRPLLTWHFLLPENIA